MGRSTNWNRRGKRIPFCPSSDHSMGCISNTTLHTEHLWISVPLGMFLPPLVPPFFPSVSDRRRATNNLTHHSMSAQGRGDVRYVTCFVSSAGTALRAQAAIVSGRGVLSLRRDTQETFWRTVEHAHGCVGHDTCCATAPSICCQPNASLLDEAMAEEVKQGSDDSVAHEDKPYLSSSTTAQIEIDSLIDGKDYSTSLSGARFVSLCLHQTRVPTLWPTLCVQAL